MATNVFNETQYRLNDVYIRFWNSLSFARTANRNLEGDFKDLQFATGQTLNYRLEERYLGGEGATATSESRVQIIKPLSITKQFHTMLQYTGFELTFDRARDEPYLEMANAPRAKELANKVEKFIARDNLWPQTYQAVGTPGVPVDLNTILTADAYMTELGIPEDGKRFCGIQPRTAANLSNDLFTVFNSTVNTGALIDGFVGHLSGFDFFKTNFLGRQVAGLGQAGGSPPAGFLLGGSVTNGPITSGNTIAVDGLGQAPGAIVFQAGDIIEIDDSAGVFMVNPLTYEPLQQRAQFTVTSQVISADGATATIPINPGIILDGALQNISAAIPEDAQILLSASHNVSVAYHTQAIVFAAPPIKELRGGVETKTAYSELYKMALTYSLGADIVNYQQYDRVDIICGVAINPQFAVRIRS
jgi:hypothetical protein